MIFKRFTTAVLLGALALSLTPTAIAAGGGIEPFVKMKWPSGATLAPDGTIYYVYNPDGIRQLFKVSPGQSQDQAKQLTSFEDGIGGYDLSDDGKWIAITASVGGSEQADLFLMDARTGEMKTLFEDSAVVYGSVTWRRDSKAFAYRANDADPTDFHLYLYDIGSGAHTSLHAADGYFYPTDFSADGSRMLFGKYHNATHSQVFELDIPSGKVREVSPEGAEQTFFAVGYYNGDRSVLVTTDYQRDLRTLMTIDLASGKISPVVSDMDGHEVDFAELSDDRKLLALGFNEDGYRTLHLRNTSDFSPAIETDFPEGIVGNIDFEGSHMLYSVSNANTPGVIYKMDLTAPSKKPVAVTEADTQGIDVSKFRLPELVHYPSFDGTKIPAFVYLPADYKKGDTIPFIAYYHGGPEGQFRPGFNKTFQYFIANGYGIVAPNVRGSSGYGKAYLEADNYKNRMISVKDGVAAAKYVIDQGYTEPRKVAAWGGSYGGFMTMAVITEAPELFGAACNVVGIVNFQTFLEQTKAYRRHLREAEYGPLSDPEFLQSISPLNKVDRITTPLMLAHGLNDPRVPVGEAMQVAVALKKRGQDVEELYFPDEGHGFAKRENQLLYYGQLAKFFDLHLKATSSNTHGGGKLKTQS